MKLFFPKLHAGRKKDIPVQPDALNDVFGIKPRPNDFTYVDRGQFDATLTTALSQGQHIAIHGASKQGKTWLCAKVLGNRPHIMVHCQPTFTVNSLFAEVARKLGALELAELTYSGEGTAGTDLKAFKAEVTGSIGKKYEPVGHAGDSVGWLADVIRKSRKLVIIEDCHYLSDDVLRDLSFILKALYENEAYIILAGIWTEEQKLTYYNGDLDGRVRYIHLRWSAEELEQVIRKGCTALNIQMTSSLRRAIVRDSAGNVGLTHRLAEEICRAEGVAKPQEEFLLITMGFSLAQARRNIARDLAKRYEKFSRDFSESLRSAGYSGELDPTTLLHAVVEMSNEDDLPAGLTCDALATKIKSLNAPFPEPRGLGEILCGLAVAQEKMEVKPAILSYDENDHRLYITDRSLFFVVHHGGLRWPWDPA